VVHEISEAGDWYLSADTLKAASIDHSQHYHHLDPILTDAIKAHRITPAWVKVVRLVASMSSPVGTEPADIGLRSQYALHLYSWAKKYVETDALREMSQSVCLPG
jgi:hypothetical protein